MPKERFPYDTYLKACVKLLDTVKYHDDNYTRAKRVEKLEQTYKKTAKHFAQSHVQDTLKVPPERLAAALKTIVGMVVYSWVMVSPELMTDLSIHYTYTLLLDDSNDNPAPAMQTWYNDLLNGKAQDHGWWRLRLAPLWGYCKMNIVRSTIDFFQACWIEQHNFKGFPGSHDYPGFLRRMNGLGHCVGASLWPADEFDEEKLSLEITTAIAQMENWMVLVNDLFSLYKEHFVERD
ncbi:Trichodiene synthase [Cladobotryum mycophilum]|uniref:Trichodiene synthase n=1 Tax=Cladobotryum mycophilum TaxID=491253 RepID=A0ABR0SI53_9HYPO